MTEDARPRSAARPRRRSTRSWRRAASRACARSRRSFGLSDPYDNKRLEAGCALALRADGRMKTVRDILAADLDPAQLELPAATSAGAYLHGPGAIVGEGAR